MKSNKRDNSSSKKSKYKKDEMKKIATEYLRSISLNGNSDSDIKNDYFDQIISNDYDRFLSFNKINTKSDKQTEYFNYYKQKLLIENRNSSRLSEFLSNEFDDLTSGNNFGKVYVDEILSKKRSLSSKTCSPTISPNKIGQESNFGVLNEQPIPSITIMPSVTFSNVTELNNEKMGDYKLSFSDAESDYFKAMNPPVGHSELISSNITVSSSSTTSINKLNQSFNSSSKSRPKLTKSPKAIEINMNPLVKTSSYQQAAVNYLNPKPSSVNNTNPSRRPYQRTISESSTESNCQTVGRNSGTQKSFMHYKPSLFNNLRRLTNEKMIFTSNNIPLGLFSRIAFRPIANKYTFDKCNPFFFYC